MSFWKRYIVCIRVVTITRNEMFVLYRKKPIWQITISLLSRKKRLDTDIQYVTIAVKTDRPLNRKTNGLNMGRTLPLYMRTNARLVGKVPIISTAEWKHRLIL